MKITFDTNNPAEVQEVLAHLKVMAGGETAVAGAMNIQTNPENRQDPAQVNEPEVTHDPDEVDSLGMKWDEAIHASTRTKKNNGEWKARSGAADAHKAAVAAHKAAQAQTQAPAAQTEAPAAQTQAPVGGGMPTGMPTMPNPADEVVVPADPIDYDTMSTRFVGMMESGQITNHSEVYRIAKVTNPADLTSNETLRANIWQVMEGIDSGKSLAQIEADMS